MMARFRCVVWLLVSKVLTLYAGGYACETIIFHVVKRNNEQTIFVSISLFFRSFRFIHFSCVFLFFLVSLVCVESWQCGFRPPEWWINLLFFNYNNLPGKLPPKWIILIEGRTKKTKNGRKLIAALWKWKNRLFAFERCPTLNGEAGKLIKKVMNWKKAIFGCVQNHYLPIGWKS